MTTIFSSCRRTSGLAVVMMAGLALAACASSVTSSPARYAENFSPRVMSDAVLPQHVTKSLSSDACVPDTQTFAEDCGGFVRYEGP